jgi:hypothetical protein
MTLTQLCRQLPPAAAIIYTAKLCGVPKQEAMKLAHYLTLIKSLF